jgi:uncharacterized protein YlxW (UPF0749 family)
MTGALAGFLFVASSGTAQGTDLRTDLGDLRSLVAEEQSRADGTAQRLTGLRAEVEDLTAVVGRSDSGTRSVETAAQDLAPLAGFVPVEGGGVVVTLDDAPADAATRARVESLDDLVVHQQDVQAVVNALWLAGAEGIMLMDQRLISTSAVRCVGNTLSLQGRPYSPPYVVTAVGDPDELTAALEASPEVQVYRQYVDAYGLGYSVETREDLQLPEYTGPVDLQHAEIADPGDLAAAGA